MADDDPPRDLGRELRSATRLVIDATQRVTSVVEDMHHTIGGGPALLGHPLRPLVKLFSAPVYASIRGVAELVGLGLDRLLEDLEPTLRGRAPGAQYDAVRAALNGVLGDQLEATYNPLAISLSLRHERRTLSLDRAALAAAVPSAGPRVVVLVHGSSMDDAGWARKGHDHGAALARDLGVSAITARYNSGRHVSINGRELAHQLQRLVDAWPCAVTSLAVVGFSMGGLVARAAIHTAETEGLAWRRALGSAVFLGTPHHGAPLERIGNLLGVLLDLTAYSAPIGQLTQIRSAGVTDLRYGNVLEAHWIGRDRFANEGDMRTPCPLPASVDCVAIAGTTAVDVADATRALPGDGLVPVASALGRHADPALDLHFPLDRQHVIPGKGHLDLLDSGAAYALMRAFLEP